jgi:hypothetical protein
MSAKRGRPRKAEPTKQANYRFRESIAERLTLHAKSTRRTKTHIMETLLDNNLPALPITGEHLLS